MDLSAFVNKTVSCRFAGAQSEIALSHGLFSSFDIDSGTRLLLKSLAARAGMESVETLADIGCGTGVIGIAAARAFPGLRVAARDRDALALAFTGMNAAANGVADRVSPSSALLLDFPQGARFDRIVSNLPAKAGKEALSDFFRRSPAFLSSGGSVWVVIVNTLAMFAESEIALAGHELLHREAGKEHAVFGFRAGAAAAGGGSFPADPLAPYLRGNFSFQIGRASYSLESARDIPDFDTPGFGLSLTVKFLESRHCAGLAEKLAEGLAVWNPGQGHLPLYCALCLGAGRFILAGRDFLELSLSERNLRAAAPDARIEVLHAADPACLAQTLPAGSIGAFIAFPELIPGYPWAQSFFESARALLPPGGLAIAQSTSAALSCLDKKRPEGFSPSGDRREKAFRIAQFVKR